jgi:hypothetical protein
MSAATSRIIQRSLSATGPWTTIATGISPTAITYNDTDVTNGTTYYYRIIGVNEQGNSEPSNVASATPSAVTFDLTDTFTDTNGTSLPDHTPDFNPAGNSYVDWWAVIKPEINNNTFALVDANNGNGFGASIEMNSSPENWVLTASGTSFRDVYTNKQGFNVRGTIGNFSTSANGSYWIGLDEAGGPLLAIRAATVNGTLLASTAITWNDGDAFSITITATGDTIDVDLTLDSTDYSVSYSSATSRGVYFGMSGRGALSLGSSYDWLDEWELTETT